jgi:proteasome lid subunit RPN8/RPN11
LTVKIELSRKQRDTVTLEAEKAFPAECCGLLIGRGQSLITVTNVVAVENQAESQNRFLIDPQCQFDWMRKLRGTNERIVGLYHSHPNGRTTPSSHDAEMAIDPDQLWLIVPMTEGVAGEIAGFQSKGAGEGFCDASVVIADES